jgi:hypothetical protein
LPKSAWERFCKVKRVQVNKEVAFTICLSNDKVQIITVKTIVIAFISGPQKGIIYFWLLNQNLFTFCFPLLVELFLHSYEAEFIQKLLHEKNQSLAMAFNSTF